MAFEFLVPVSEDIVEANNFLSEQCLGRQIQIHTKEEGVPDLDGIDVVFLGVREQRNRVNKSSDASVNFDKIRSSLYGLYPGNWSLKFADLGDILPGDEVSDTYFVIKEVVSTLLQKNIVPLLIGGSQDIVYAQYRSYDILERMVNLVNVDSRFDIGNASEPISNQSFVSRIIVDEPYNLFNYSNLGYQTYFNAQEEIDLIEKLYFDAYRLGEVINDVTIVEPIMRDADIVTIDLGAISSNSSPNGFNGREICAIARYAGISDKVKSFGIYEYDHGADETSRAMLVAQIFWYFIEGLNYRSNELDIKSDKSTLHYSVPIDNEVLSFYKSVKTERWWIEIPFLSSGHNKLERHTLLPCTYNDYERACNQEIPERWYKAKRKNEV
ncbi:formimidoylglutamase [Aquimarina intermedia]|uniref:Arginase family enzyme n=1 Tax=Aquimarina intermedia TaxID=350814 RepID=A0A5S5CF50_9FLAO|nr:formimidoylglutamase [Aquimarina intermedia]TYP77298.1 arginase family enzyme [Aquimarina intermedia]